MLAPLIALLLLLVNSAGLAQSTLAAARCLQAAEKTADGKNLAAQKRYTEAIQEFRAALGQCPDNRGAALELTRVYLSARRFAEAERLASDILAHDPSSEAAQLLLANSYFMQQRFPEAGKTLQKLLTQDDRNVDAHKMMGLTLFFYKEYTLAERELARSLQLKPYDEDAQYYLGRVYYTQKNFAPAVEAFRKLIDWNPKSYKAYDNLGLCYEALEKPDEAVVAFTRAQELARTQDPSYDWPFANLAEMLIKQNRSKEALSYAQEAARINPHSARNQYLVAKALSSKDDLQSPLPYLFKATQLDPDYAEPHYLLGQLYQKLGRRAEAQREFALFQEISKRTPRAKR
jgi:tetratricopeptide (TPR) repeat protein